MTATNLLHVAVQTEEVEDAAAVHLGWMEAAHHGDRAGAQNGGGGGLCGGEGLWEQRWVGDHLLSRLVAPPVPAVCRERQKGALGACRHTDACTQTTWRSE